MRAGGTGARSRRILPAAGVVSRFSKSNACAGRRAAADGPAAATRDPEGGANIRDDMERSARPSARGSPHSAASNLLVRSDRCVGAATTVAPGQPYRSPRLGCFRLPARGVDAYPRASAASTARSVTRSTGRRSPRPTDRPTDDELIAAAREGSMSDRSRRVAQPDRGRRREADPRDLV